MIALSTITYDTTEVDSGSLIVVVIGHLGDWTRSTHSSIGDLNQMQIKELSSQLLGSLVHLYTARIATYVNIDSAELVNDLLSDFCNDLRVVDWTLQSNDSAVAVELLLELLS